MLVCVVSCTHQAVKTSSYSRNAVSISGISLQSHVCKGVRRVVVTYTRFAVWWCTETAS